MFFLLSHQLSFSLSVPFFSQTSFLREPPPLASFFEFPCPFSPLVSEFFPLTFATVLLVVLHVVAQLPPQIAPKNAMSKRSTLFPGALFLDGDR